MIGVDELPNTAATFLWLLCEAEIKTTAKPTSASSKSVHHYCSEGRSLTFDEDESQFQLKRSSEDPVFAKVNAEPLILRTDEDRTYDISSPVPKIRAFYPLRFFWYTNRKIRRNAS